jgi:hypothetical protein
MTYREMWDFKVITNSDCVQINTAENTLICNCSDANIALAINEYNAILKESVALL